MRTNIFFGAVIVFLNVGCATKANYDIHGLYKSKNNSLNLVSKLTILKSGSYMICTSTLDHEKEHVGDGNYYCIEGVWNQQKNKVTLIANTWEGKLGVTSPEKESVTVLESAENLANPTTLSILQPSGETMSDISVNDDKSQKAKGWDNYHRAETLY